MVSPPSMVIASSSYDLAARNSVSLSSLRVGSKAFGSEGNPGSVLPEGLPEELPDGLPILGHVLLLGVNVFKVFDLGLVGWEGHSDAR